MGLLFTGEAPVRDISFRGLLELVCKKTFPGLRKLGDCYHFSDFRQIG